MHIAQDRLAPPALRRCRGFSNNYSSFNIPTGNGHAPTFSIVSSRIRSWPHGSAPSCRPACPRHDHRGSDTPLSLSSAPHRRLLGMTPKGTAPYNRAMRQHIVAHVIGGLRHLDPTGRRTGHRCTQRLVRWTRRPPRRHPLLSDWHGILESCMGWSRMDSRRPSSFGGTGWRASLTSPSYPDSPPRIHSVLAIERLIGLVLPSR